MIIKKYDKEWIYLKWRIMMVKFLSHSYILLNDDKDSEKMLECNYNLTKINLHNTDDTLISESILNIESQKPNKIL